MLKPIELKLLKTLDELFESDIRINYDLEMNYIDEENEKFKKAIEEGRVGNFLTVFKNSSIRKFIAERKTAYFDFCSFNRYVMNYGDGKTFQGIYVIPEVVATIHYNFMVAPLSPYFDKFQSIMNICFEAGLHKAWRIFYEIDFLLQNIKISRNIDQRKNTLDFKTIFPFFAILGIGFGISLLVLFCEIFYHDFLLNLSKDYFMRILRRKITGKKVTKIKNIRIRNNLRSKSC